MKSFKRVIGSKRNWIKSSKQIIGSKRNWIKRAFYQEFQKDYWSKKELDQELQKYWIKRELVQGGPRGRALWPAWVVDGVQPSFTLLTKSIFANE